MVQFLFVTVHVYAFNQKLTISSRFVMRNQKIIWFVPSNILNVSNNSINLFRVLYGQAGRIHSSQTMVRLLSDHTTVGISPCLDNINLGMQVSAYIYLACLVGSEFLFLSNAELLHMLCLVSDYRQSILRTFDVPR